MKKLFSFVAIALFIIGLGVLSQSEAFAAAANITSYAGGMGLGDLRSITTINSDAAGYDVTTISSTYIEPGKCKILGYRASALAGAMIEGVFSIRDASTTSVTTSNTDTLLFAENEVFTALPSTGEMFPAAMNIQNGLTIHQGPKTVVTVYYIQVRE